MSLKTHVIFDSVRAVFNRNAEMIGGSIGRKEKARKLITKIVNTLSAKMEMGSPMICMYLLGNPDHYKSHEFAVFYWQSYVLALIKRHGRIVGLSPVLDYTHRPVQLSNMCLYDWVRRCQRAKLPKKKSGKKHDLMELTDDGASDIDGDHHEQGVMSSSDTDTESDGPSFGNREIAVTSVTEGSFTLMKSHPLSGSHCTRCVSEREALVPNFVGPVLPRPDQGDREYYCSAMLTFFKPWRSGEDLKLSHDSWDAAFVEYDFTKRQKEIMGNFNLKYECLDAKDDFQAQLRAGAVTAPGWSGIREGVDVMSSEQSLDPDGGAVDICTGNLTRSSAK
ncbi:hypothetical protein BD779DRAFT_1443222 [Infundibulicybe gibba]|nr:hypothetical protein BD779DRAFT_1443222 [Infundibulicybe gibba]